MKTCARCKRAIKGKPELFFDRHYHLTCYVIFLVRYKELRVPMQLDRLSVKEVNRTLDMLQWYDPSIHD